MMAIQSKKETQKQTMTTEKGSHMTDLVQVRYGKTLREFHVPEMPELLTEQVDDGRFLFENINGALFSEPGTGKTLTALLALNKIYDGMNANTLIVVPNIAIRNWIIWTSSAFRAWQDCDANALIQVITSGSDDIDPETSVLIVTYGMFSRRDSKITKRVIKWCPDVVIMDESDNLNGYDSARTKVLYGRPGEAGISQRAQWSWSLTGTPIRRYADDLYPMLRSLHPVVLKEKFGITTRAAFLNKFCVTKKMRFGNARFPTTVVVASKNMGELHELLYDCGIAVRRRLVDVVDRLPEVRERVISLDFKPSVLLQDLTASAMDQTQEMDAFGNMVDVRSAAMTKAQHQLGVEKIYLAAKYILNLVDMDHVNGIDRGIIVLCWHRDVIQELAEVLDKRGVPADVIHGGMNTRSRDFIVDLFNEKKIKVLIGQIAAMGVSLNLQLGSNYVIFVERSWSDASNEQAWKRVFRLGQKLDVQIDYLIADSVLEEPKSNVLDRKREGALRVVDGLTTKKG